MDGFRTLALKKLALLVHKKYVLGVEMKHLENSNVLR
jgi:hypothetical protein